MKTILTILIALADISQARADQLDTLLQRRDTMVSAVAILADPPPQCGPNNNPPTPQMIARFMSTFGYMGDDAFMAEVAAKVRFNKQLALLPKSEELDFICDYHKLLTVKVRAVNGP